MDKEFLNYLDNLSKDEIDEYNRIETEYTKKKYIRFRTAFKENKCYLCESSLDKMNKNKPCVHWLLVPIGFKKKHITDITKYFGYFQIESYLRWVVNLFEPFKNINDYSEEQSGTKIIENTIVYKNIEWSFSCAESDLLGHINSKHSNFPHYHFQMRIEKKPFIDFTDLHIPFTNDDLLHIEVIRGKYKNIKHQFIFGEGMGYAMVPNNIETLLKYSQQCKDENKALFHISTSVEADEGKVISGDKIAEIIREANEKNVPIASLIHKLDGEIITDITPSEVVPFQAQRKRKRGKKST